MARPIRSIDIYLPLNYNDGEPVEELKFISLQQELLARYRGVTSQQQQFPLQGLWQAEGELYLDRVVIFTVFDFRAPLGIEWLRYLEKLKTRLKKRFRQMEVLITIQDMLAI